MTTYLASRARSEFDKGNFSEAIELYKRLGQQIGSLYFSANITLCNKKMAKEKKHSYESHKQEYDTNSLIQYAKRIATQKKGLIGATQRKIIIIHDKETLFEKEESTFNSLDIGKYITSGKWESIHLHLDKNKIQQNLTTRNKINTDGTQHKSSNTQPITEEVSTEDEFLGKIHILSDIFQIHKPSLVIADCDHNLALPTIVAAQQLSILTIKKELDYSTETNIQNSKKLFSEIYALEQACLDLANHSYYANPKHLSPLLNLVKSTINEDDKTPSIKLSPKEKKTLKYKITQNGLHHLEIEIDSKNSSEGDEKGIVMCVRHYTKEGALHPIRIENFYESKEYPQYKYISTLTNNGPRKLVLFTPPKNTHYIEVDIVAFIAKKNIALHNIKLGNTTITEIADWITCKPSNLEWIKDAERFLQSEGALSLRLALLNYKYKKTKHTNDFQQLTSAIEEMVELNRIWTPEIAQHSIPIKSKNNSKLTIIHLHKTAYPYENSGGAIRCLNTVVSQQRIGIDPYIVTPIGYPRSVGITTSKNHETIEGIDHYRIGSNTDGLRGLSLADRTRYSVFHIAKLLRMRGADIIHAASGVRGYELALQGVALRRMTGLPLLYEVRSFHEHTWTGVRDDVMNLEKTRLRVIKEDFCMAEADFITTISFSMKKILIERGVPPEKIEVIPNAIDESKYLNKQFHPIKNPALQGAELTIGYISNMSTREGHQYLIRAIHQLRKETDMDIRCLLVGDGPERKNLERLSKDLGIEKIVSFPGEVDHREINSYYMAIDIFIIPRIPDYAADWVTPLKPYEAMALNRPIIVSDLPALREIVGDNEERGLLAIPGDVNSLVQQVKRYINDPDLRMAKITNARNWVFNERTWSANAKRYEAIYKKLKLNHINFKEDAIHA